MLVHRPGEPGVFLTEDSPIGPTWAYPESKVRTEAVIRAERGAIPAVILRFAGVYDDVCHSPPLAHQIQRIYERQLAGHLYSGETSHGQSFVHLDDVVDAIERAIEHRAKLPPETAILIGEPEALSYDELQHTFSAADSRRVVGDAQCPRADCKGRRVGARPDPRPGSVHQTVDDRPGQRPLRPRHHARPHLA